MRRSTSDGTTTTQRGGGKHYDGAVSEVSEGLRLIGWSVFHPGRTILRSFGVFMGIAGAVSITSGLTYFFVGEPYTAQFRVTDLSSVLKTGADGIRPLADGTLRALDETIRPAEASDDYDGSNYRD